MKTMTIGQLYISWKTIEAIYDSLPFARVVELIPEMQRLKSALLEFEKRENKMEVVNTEVEVKLFTQDEVKAAIENGHVKPSAVLDLL